MGKALVIVESPAKARTIEKYLGPGFQVEASVGHVRDLPRNASEIPAAKKKEPWARLGVNVEASYAPLYVIPAEKKAQVKKLRGALAGADALYLATDEDREGESISWHLMEVLRPKVPVRRLVFNEITQAAIQRALANPRDVDVNLVRAQETRRIVDRLFGYEVSPLLWRKIRPQLSAGRVQSVAVRLVVERERERMAFKSATWWDVEAQLDGQRGAVSAQLVRWKGKRLASGRDFDDRGQLKSSSEALVLDSAGAKAVCDSLAAADAKVVALEEKAYRDRPAPPFTTSTLQQEANRKLRWTARRTMQVAQRLYETGWITYMRTDSTTLSQEALGAARGHIETAYGPDYLPKTPRTYKSKAKNAQEAHEAIRPAGASFRGLDEAQSGLDRDESRLYGLIWKRTVASQMTDALGRRLVLRFEASEGELVIRGKTVDFPGYRRAYVEGTDDPAAELQDQERVLPPYTKGDVLQVADTTAKDHATQPPARLTEASLVKEMETRGIGRPSTYASIIDTILRRDYVFKKGSALVPTFTAFAVVGLLEQHLSWLVDYGFTARIEDELDRIAVGTDESLACLQRFYEGDAGLKHQLSDAAEVADPRALCTFPVMGADEGEDIMIRVGRYGPYLASGDVRADIPDDLPPDELTIELARELIATRKEGPRVLGKDPDTQMDVQVMDGRFGPYVQLGEAQGKTKPKRTSLLKGMAPDTVTLDQALGLLSLPRALGNRPESGEPVLAALGRYGPYVKSGKDSRSIPEGTSVLEIELAAALALLAEPPKRRRGNAALKELGTDQSTDRTVKLMNGRFGPYVTDGETNVSLKKGADPDELDLPAAIAMIRLKETQPKRPKRATKRKKAPAKAKAKTAKAKTAKSKTAKSKTAKSKTAKSKTAKSKTAKAESTD